MGKIIHWFIRKAKKAFSAYRLLSILTITGLLLYSLPASGQVIQSNTEYAEDRVIIKFADQNAQENFLSTESRIQTSQLSEIARTGSALMNLDEMTVQEAIEEYRNNPNVEYIEPDYKVYAIEPVNNSNVIPNDPGFDDLWGLHNTGQTGGVEDADIDAPEAWDTKTGNEEIIIGVIDTGVDYDHEDLINNMWINPGETPDNGVDDDGNGYVDDYYGYDFFNDNGDPMDEDGHGTHVAGTIAAERENNLGISGVSEDVKIMALKFLGPDGGFTSDAVLAIQYAIDMGAHLTNNSWGGGGFSQSLEDAINAAADAGQLFMAAAGNEGLDNDVEPHYPSSYDLENIISVASTDDQDELSGFSNFGETSVDLGAPGSSILSTTPDNSYNYLNGTSMATPHVSGVAAMILAEDPDLTQQEVRARILDSVDPLPALDGVTVTGGRLNANKALEGNDDTPPEAITDLTADSVTNSSVNLNWTAPGDDGASGTATSYDIRYSTSEITADNFSSATEVPNDLNPQPAGNAESFTVTDLDYNTTYYFAIKATDDWGNTADISNSPSVTTDEPPVIVTTPSDSMGVNLDVGDNQTETLQIENQGDGELEFNLDANQIQDLQAEQHRGERGEGTERTLQPDQGAKNVLLDKFENQINSDSVIFNDDFENGVNDWTVEVYSGDDIWHQTNLNYNSDFTSWWPGIEETVNYDTGSRVNTALVSPTIDLSEIDNQSLSLYFFEYINTEPGWDYCMVDVSTDGGSTWTPLRGTADDGNAPSGDSGGWIFSTLDLSDYTGETIQIRFYFDTIDDVSQNYPGWFVDDVFVGTGKKVLPWLAYDETSGTVGPNSSMDIDVNFDATGLNGGLYNADINIQSNDPENPEINVRAGMDVDGIPAIALAADSLNFGEIPNGSTTKDTLWISNTGTDLLSISNITSDIEEFSPEQTTMEIPPDNVQMLTITYSPTSVGTDEGQLTIESNDPDNSSVTAKLVGESLDPPLVSITPDSLSSSLESGNTEVQNITIDNSDGGSQLTWEVSVLPKDNGNEMLSSLDMNSWSDSEESAGEEEGNTPHFEDSNSEYTGELIQPQADDLNIAIVTSESDDQNISNFLDQIVSTQIYTKDQFEIYNDPESLSVADLDTIDVAMVWSNSTFTDPDMVGDTLKAYVDNGGAIVMSTYSYSAPWALQGDIMMSGYSPFIPSEIQFVSGELDLNSLTDPDHPIFSNISNNPIYWSNSNYSNPSLNDNAVLLASDTDGNNVIAQNSAGNVVGINIFPPQIVESNSETTNLFANAIQYVSTSSIYNFVSVDTIADTVEGGNSQQVDVTFDATDLYGGEYDANIVFTSNDPASPKTEVPAHLDVSGIPEIDLSAGNLDFGIVYLGYSAEKTLEVSNTGTDLLEVTEITSGNADFTPETSSFSLDPNESKSLKITYNPSEEGAPDTELTIDSNDPEQPSVTVGLSGESVEPPVVSVNPDSIGSDLLEDESEVQTLTIDNTDGGSALEFFIQKKEYNKALAFEERPFVDGTSSEESNKQRIESDFEPTSSSILVIQNTSAWGVDLANFIDQNFDVTPSHISSDQISSTDFSQYDLIITAGDQTSTYYSDISSSVSKFEDFLNNGGTVQYQVATQGPDVDLAGGVTSIFDNSELYNIVEDKIHPIVSELPDTLEGNFANHNYMVDFPKNTNIITTTEDSGSPTTIEYSYGEGKVIATGMTWEWLYTNGYPAGPLMYNAINYSLGNLLDWITFSQQADKVEAGNTVDVEVTIDATDKPGGEYLANLDVTTNDPENSSVDVPVGLTVTGVGDISLSVNSIDFGKTFLGYSNTTTFSVDNEGSEVLEVEDITSDNDEIFSPDPSSFSVDPGGSVTVDVTYSPGSVGSDQGELTISSDDPDEPSVTVDLSGEAVEPPVVSLDPNSIEKELEISQQDSATLTIDNTDGGSELNYSVQITPDQQNLQKRVAEDQTISTNDSDDRASLGAESQTVNGSVQDINRSIQKENNSSSRPLSGDDEDASEVLERENNTAAVDLPFSDGFESGTYDKWINSGFFDIKAVVDSVSAVGEQSFYYNNIDQDSTHFHGIEQQFSTGTQPKYASFFVRSSDVNKSDAYVVLYDFGVGSIIWFFADNNGNFYVNEDVGGNNSYKYNPNQWYHIEFRDIDWSAKDFDFYVNGDLVQEDIPFRRADQTSEIEAAYLHNFSPNSKAWWDNVLISDQQINWLTLSSSSGSVPAGESENIKAYLDATGLSSGTYKASLEINNNDPENSTVSIPVNMEVSESKVVSIGLREGWNLKSFNVQPDQNSTENVLDGIIENLHLALGFKDGEGQTFDPSLPESVKSTLETMDSHHGYWLRMNSDDTLNINGSVTDPQTPLQLQQGFNLVSYLPEKPDSLMHALSDIMDKVEIVLGFDGGGLTFDPSVPDGFNTLNTLEPKNGYWIKLSESAELIYPTNQIAEPEEEQPPLAKSKEEEQSNPVKPTREWITVWGEDLRVDGELVPEGTVVQAIDSDGVVCGQAIIEEEGQLKMMSIYRDDPDTEVDEGAENNEQITLNFGNYSIENAVMWSNRGDVTDLSGQNAHPSSSAIPDEYALKQNYPNPFNPTTTIRYALPEQSEVSIKVYNILGRLVTTLVENQEKEPGNYKVTFDGSQLASGMYFYRIKAGDFVETKKLLLIK